MLVKRKIVEQIESPWIDACAQIRARHRRRRYAIKLQQKIDRALESFIRLNLGDWNEDLPDWSPDLSEKERTAINRAVLQIIVAARKGDGPEEVVGIVKSTDESRKPADAMRAKYEKEMITSAETLPVAGWIGTTHGAGLLGLSIIVGEAGALDSYPNVAKLWKRLGFAPYDGFAGSTWKRESWRPRALTKEEWIANPFSGERYAQMHELATWLVNKQWISAKKLTKEAKEAGLDVEIDEGKPNGPFGEIYFARRKHTAVTHPDWTKMHSRQDALRVTFKTFLAELWSQWMAAAREHMPTKDVE